MAYEQKPGDAVLFRNDKGDNPKRPDYTGKGLDSDGNEVKLSGWVKEGKRGKFLSVRIERVDPAPEPQTESTSGDDLPF